MTFLDLWDRRSATDGWRSPMERQMVFSNLIFVRSDRSSFIDDVLLYIQWQANHSQVQWSIGPSVHWSIGSLVEYKMCYVKCQKSNVKYKMWIRLNFCRRIPPELLRSFITLQRQSFLYKFVFQNCPLWRRLFLNLWGWRSASDGWRLPMWKQNGLFKFNIRLFSLILMKNITGSQSLMICY